MNAFSAAALVLNLVIFGIGCWLGCQLMRQNGRLLLRLEALEERLDELDFGEPNSHESEGTFDPKSETNQSLVPSTAAVDEGRAARFNNRSLGRSKIKRDGLKAGTPAPDFRLPRLDDQGELSLEEFRGQRVLLVFSDPSCGPCNALAPELEKFHRQGNALSFPSSQRPEPDSRATGTDKAVPSSPEIIMISRGEPKENRAKVKEHGLTFPIVLQQQWEISRRYAMFATPIAYLIDEAGVVTCDVAAGVDAIVAMMKNAVEPRMRADRAG